MSSAAICLFSVALCNIGTLDQSLFNQAGNNQQQQQQNPNLFGQATNVFNGFVNTGLGYLGGQQQQQGQRQRLQSPCGKKFQYVTDGREWKGLIKIGNADLSRDLVIEADFVLPQNQQFQHQNHRHHNHHGKIELVNDPETVADDLENNLPLLFEVHFRSQNPVPRLLAIYKNKREICRANIDVQAQIFRLKYILPASDEENADRFTLSGQHNIQPQPQPQSRPPQNPPIHAQNPQNPLIQRPSSDSNINQFQDDKNVCGVPVVLSQSLVVGGAPVQNHGEWPWLIAFYKSSEGNLQFICGGSLLNARFVLTAAHCIQDKGSETAQLNPQDALLFIGKHNLIQWNEEGYEKRGALAFKVHPDWTPSDQKYDSDLALIQMDKPVKYSKFIRPICLWSGPPEITKVVGQVGIVAGWGKNDDGKLNTDFPKKVNVPIVSDGTCLRAHEAFVHITSDRTFCAGGRNGEGPCQGDSGGGLVLKVGKKWFIRGIVSASLRDGLSCDVNSYAIFTDIAAFVPWIQSEMRNV
ncbi:serine protease gd-like [Chironomus tepperi]|uniref:serine protease gd-like n=1 Tax=Chironomus tepperi TaxID=113505 RepID=UPI00391F5E9B